jgi:hypothetical protein
MLTKTEAAPAPSSVAAAAPPAQDRRKSRRYLCTGDAKVIVLGGALTFVGQIQDLSMVGCRVVTEVAFTLERGTHVEVVMVIEHVNFRVAAGVRSNHKTRGVGLEFTHLSTRCARLVQDLIAEIEHRQQTPPPNPAA